MHMSASLEAIRPVPEYCASTLFFKTEFLIKNFCDMKIDIYPLQTINMKKNFALRLVLKAWFCSVLFIERKMQFLYVTVALRGTKVIT